MADLSGVSTTSLELYLDFENDTQDESGNNRDQVTTVGLPVYVSDGAPGVGATFSYPRVTYIDTGVQALGSADLFCTAGQSFSTACFIRFTGASTYGAGTILSRQKGTGQTGRLQSTFFLHVSSDHRLLLRLRGEDNYYNVNLHDGDWHHIAFVWNGTTGAVYIDNELQSTPNVGAIAEYPVNIYIAGSAGLPTTKPRTSDLSGDLDELRIYSRALSASEINLLYLYGKPTAGSAPIGPFDNLELWLELEDDYLDSSNKLRHQTANVQGNPTFVDGKAGVKGLRLDGTGDCIATGESALGDASLYNGTGDAWTALAWTRQVAPGQAGGDFISRERVSPNVGGFRMATTTADFGIAIGGTITAYSGATDIADGNWHLIAVTFDDNDSPKALVYYDGAVQSNPGIGAEADGTVDIVIGARRGTGADPGAIIDNFDGDIDDVRIYSRALTAAEILQIYEESGIDQFSVVLTLTSVIAGVATITATFDNAPTSFGAADVDVTNGTDSNFSGSGTSYTFNVTPTGSSLVTVSIAEAAVMDSSGHENRASNVLRFSVGGVADPTNTGLERFDRAATRTFTAECIIGPVKLSPSSQDKGIISHARTTFGSGTTATGTLAFSGGVDGEDAANRADNDAAQYSAVISSLQTNHGVCHPCVGGHAATFVLTVTAGHCVFEEMSLMVDPAGYNNGVRYA